MASVGISEGAECTVCEHSLLACFREVGGRMYLRCPHCEATIMAQKDWLAPDQERAVYELHDNDSTDSGYRAFLDKLALPLLERIPAGAQGLDFGCGPGPALADMLDQAGMDVTLYDPFFYPHPFAVSRQYDFVTCTEVVEHLRYPAMVFRKLDELLRPGGWLGVMTCFQTSDDRFDNWHYRRDPTHIVFYREATLALIARKLGWSLVVPRKDVAIFHKPSGSGTQNVDKPVASITR